MGIVNNARTGLVGFGATTLLPGANVVDDKIIEEMKKHPAIKAMVEEGSIEFPSNVTIEKGLTEMSQKEAQLLVEATVDASLLSQWKKKEKRKPVLSAIEKQLAKLDAPTVFRDGTNKKEE